MGIEISIKAGTTAETSSVTASGSIEHVVTDKEVETFGIKDEPLKNAVGKFFGQNPNDAYLHSDTPWGDLYRTYNWPQVQVVLVPESATITGITAEPVIVAGQTFANTSKQKGTFNAGISQTVTNTTSSTWSHTDTIAIGQKFTYEIKYLGAGGGGETSLSYEHSWGESKTESLSITVGTQGGVSVPLDPGQSVEALLTASRGVMRVRIVYKAFLIGSVAVNYNPTFKDHHFWALDIGGVMAAAGIPNSKQFTEDLEIGFYANSKIELREPSGQTFIAFSTEALPA